MEQYNVTGMSCAACSARVEKAVSKVPGVTSCSVSLLTNSMGVEGSAGFLFLLLAVGIMSFSILFGFCFHQVYKYNKRIWDIMVRILLVLNMGLSQPHIMNVALFTMMLYPYFIANSLKKTNTSYVRSC